MPFQSNKNLWGGFVISNSHNDIYFAGDTAFGPFLEEIAHKFKNIRLSILPIGNYEKRWIMKNIHMNPDDTVQTHLILKADQSMGMHYGTFAEHPEQTIDAHEIDLAKALEKHNVETSKFWVLQFGEGQNIKTVTLCS